MKRLSVVLVAILLIAMVAVSCAIIDTALLGKWGTVLGNYEFKSDGSLNINIFGVAVPYKYTASAGTGSYWVEGAEIVKTEFTYAISGTTLQFTTGDYTVTLEKL